ncbi:MULTISPECIES: phosphatidylglycerophosphatase A [unclassified Desulfovibrio]|mgnify:CR=1 FL=1|uniref:phosphatidylglycerophosphatase A family protein n=1 Tax=unclassified Desulfovibrio TaxID=2593640 RepID=UPI000F5FE206|nr:MULTISPECIES: phosphatidylglycerophosphatase A [unclassified Desulfovibrio]RRD70340.1 phosphatidylglycerophosphatase A [Desulfovibrio sp. OH1209_COT-279]RRD86837.1 phosphatidylglycerophosphatase A [Desulfovibrio sp. OH1186_COT-070]
MTPGDKLILSFCRLGVAGLDRSAPGTWGTLLACLLAPYVFFPLPLGWRIVVLAGLFVLGGLAAGRAETLLGVRDPGEIVIDELVGVWLVLLPFAKPDFWLVLAAFAFFRLFDIFKPWPVRAAENWLPGGFGIMIDDVVAGGWALACVALLRWLGALPGA